MSLLAKLKRKATQVQADLFPPTEFDPKKLPWIDHSAADVAAFVRQFKPRFPLTYNLEEKLRFWQKNGYVILEKAISDELIARYWQDVEELLEHPEKYKLMTRIDLPKFEPNQERLIGEFPKEDLKGKYVKLNDFHHLSETGKNLMTHPAITNFLEAIFQQQVVVMQSLTFMYGSQQPTHQDFPWVTAKIASHLAAAWIPLEDITIDSGPLYYYVGSHKLPKFNFSNGILFTNRSKRTPLEFANYLDTQCVAQGYPKETLLIKRGDVLIWHSALAHGGGLITNPDKTRKSFVCHYSTKEALPFHRFKPQQEPVVQTYNGVSIYKHPDYSDQENILPA
ncbi:phytanoyl-CoA dioxygenase family protein [Arundinibacter roseus]|uniref:Phytanoyl-CoA dioxygenase n=1 Tax=Arundinibacter roseus TaxID=2070510 RepID=A0A4R4KH66_9BACT|nr:phytanoyl-CoA dioxygenase family protein [Arundinibacter roseus]TDB67348.1 phytanoyl-CoA dioxygenase [Arundinibacter roseus]